MLARSQGRDAAVLSPDADLTPSYAPGYHPQRESPANSSPCWLQKVLQALYIAEGAARREVSTAHRHAIGRARRGVRALSPFLQVFPPLSISVSFPDVPSSCLPTARESQQRE